MEETCGCGKPVRYSRTDDNGSLIGSCNKYGRCPESKQDPIKLFLCPVCKHSSHEYCHVKQVGEAQEQCDEFEWNGQAEWVFYSNCPKCLDGGMLYQDKFGAACAITSCKFTQDYSKSSE